MLNRRVKRVLLALGMSLAIVSLTTGCSMLKKQPETESETEKQTEKQTAPIKLTNRSFIVSMRPMSR